MKNGKKLAASAMMGVLAAAAVLGSARAGAQALEASASGDTRGERGEKAGCKNHDGGKCGSMNAPDRR